MKLKKTYINGKEVYIPITDEEAEKIEKENQEQEELKKAQEEYNYQTNYSENNQYNNETSNEENKSGDDDYINVEQEKGSNVFFKKISKFVNKVGDKVGGALEKTGSYVKESFDTGSMNISNWQKNNEKNKKLAKMLPYLSKEAIHDLVNKIINDDENTKDLDLDIILPYLTTEDADALLIRCIEDGKTNIRINKIAQYVDKETLNKLVQYYIDGKIKLNLEDLLPYLDETNVKKIFEHEILKKK